MTPHQTLFVAVIVFLLSGIFIAIVAPRIETNHSEQEEFDRLIEQLKYERQNMWRYH